jgi:hypothetical protein
MKKRIVMKLHRPVQTPWSAHILASPLFGVTILSLDSKYLETGKSWKRSVASPSRENLETISDSRDSSNASKVHTEHNPLFFCSLLLFKSKFQPIHMPL